MLTKTSKQLIKAGIAVVVLIVLTLGKLKVSAQEVSQLLTVTQYKTPEELELLFDKSLFTISYFEGKEVEKPLYIGVFSQNAYDDLSRQGLRGEILDGTVDLSRFVYLYNREANQASALSKFGDVFSLSPYHTLLRLPQNGKLPDAVSLAGFQIIPFDSNYRKPTFPTATIAKTEEQTRAKSEAEQSQSILLVVLLPALFGSGILVFLNLRRVKLRKQK